MKADHIEGHSFAPVRKIPYTLRPNLPTSNCICIMQSDSMVLSRNNFVWWNQSAPLSVSHLCTKLGVACWMSGHCCRSALDDIQPWKLYIATLGGYLSLFCLHTLPNLSPVAWCLASPSSTPPEPQLNIFSKTSPPIVLRGFLIPIINIAFIRTSTTAYLFCSFFPHLIPRLNLLTHLSKSDRNQAFSSSCRWYKCRLNFPVE